MSQAFSLRGEVKVESGPPRRERVLIFSFQLAFSCGGVSYHYQVRAELHEGLDLPAITLARLSRCCKLSLASEWDEDSPYCPRCQKRLPQKDKSTHLVLRHPKHPVNQRSRPRRGKPGKLEQRMEVLEKWFKLENENPLSPAIVIQSVAFDTKSIVDSLIGETGGYDSLVPGLKKKYRIYPGETKKMTFDSYLTMKLESILERGV